MQYNGEGVSLEFLEFGKPTYHRLDRSLGHESGLVVPPLIRRMVDITVPAVDVAPTGDF